MSLKSCPLVRLSVSTQCNNDVLRPRECPGAESVSGAAAELVRRRELPAFAGGLGAEQAAGGGRPHQPRRQLRPAAHHRLLDGDAATPEAVVAGSVQRRRQRRRNELRRETASGVGYRRRCEHRRSRQLQRTQRHRRRRYHR